MKNSKAKEVLNHLSLETPENKLNKGNVPVHLEWEPYFDFCSNKVTGEAPVCPACGEMPYSTERCVFCGQAFIQDEKTRKFADPEPVEHMICLVCGDPQGMEFTRSKLNGHKHGKCRKCGAVMVE